MESLSECVLLKFKPDTLHTVRQLYGLDKPGRMEEAIDVLQQWINQQNHFLFKEFDRHYLERVIIFNKGSIEKAKARLENLCTMRTLMPDFFQRCKMTKTDGVVEHVILPDLTPESYRVYFQRLRKDAMLTQEILSEVIYDAIVGMEYLVKRDYNAGFVAVVDFRDISLLDVITKLNFSMHIKSQAIIQEGYGFRIKGIHFLSGSKAIEKLITLLKPAFPAKIARRFYVHSTHEALFNFLPKDILCKDYGGNVPTLSELHEVTMTTFNSENHTKHMVKMNQYQTDESKRISGKTDTFFLVGSFRHLDIE